MMRPSDFRVGLYEATTRRVVTHLTHLEDLVFTEGPTGATKAYTFLSNIVALLQGQATAPVNLSVKMDGSPALVFGPDPTDGQFFLGTKAVFSKTPKLIKAPEDVDRYYGHDRDLAETLYTAFDVLSAVTWPGILQGDLLFTPARREVRQLHGEPHLTFTPNTLTYAVPLSSELGRRLARARVAIALHTRYTGPLEALQATPFTDLTSLSLPPTIVALGGSYRSLAGTLGLTATETADLQTRLASLQRLTVSLRTNPIVQMVHTSPLLRDLMLRFQNQLVRDRFTEPPGADRYIALIAQFLGQVTRRKVIRRPNTDGDQMALDRLAEHLQQIAGIENEEEREAWTRHLTAQRQEILTEQATRSRYHEYLTARIERAHRGQERIQFGHVLLAHQGKALEELLDWQRQVVRFKALLLTKLKAVKDIQTYYQTGDGLVAGSHEGFVACDATGSMVKLVDRSTFSYLNFTRRRPHA